MASLLSMCFGETRERSDEEEPLLSHYDDDTTLQRRVHQKLHTYQMLRALSKGFMPSNEQAITNLRTLLSSAILNPDNSQLSDSGRALAHYTKLWLKQFIELLEHKNGQDQIQDFLWYLSKARVSVDYEDIVERAGKAKTKADADASELYAYTTGTLQNWEVADSRSVQERPDRWVPAADQLGLPPLPLRSQRRLPRSVQGHGVCPL